MNEESLTRAQRAVKTARQLKPQWEGYARMMTRNPKIKLQFTSGGSYTDGKTIYMRVPPELGDVTRHERDLCGRRDTDLRLLCPSCEGLEQAEGAIYHEVAHIAYQTFSKMDEAEKTDALFRGVLLEAGSDDESKRAVKIKKTWEKRKPDSFMAASHLISPWLAKVMNAGEDGRVNQAMMDARPGTKMMFKARLHNTFKRGLTLLDGTTTQYNEINENAQAVIAVYCKVTGFDYRPFMSEDVVDRLESPKLDELCARMAKARTAKDVFLWSVPVLEELRRLGFCHAPEDVEDDAPKMTINIVMPEGSTPPDESEPEDQDEQDDEQEEGNVQINVIYPDQPPEPGEGGGQSSNGDSDGQSPEASSTGTQESNEGQPETSQEDSQNKEDRDEESAGSDGDSTETEASEDTSPDTSEADSSTDEADGDEPENESDEPAQVGKGEGEGEDGEDSEPEADDLGIRGSGQDDDESLSDEETFGDGDEPESEEDSGEAPGTSSEEEAEAEREQAAARVEAEQDETEQAFNQFSGHDDMQEPGEEPAGYRDKQEATMVGIAIRQQDFDSPSATIHGVTVRRYESGSWNQRYTYGRSYVTDLAVPESIVAPSLARLRQVFSANKRSHYNNDLTSGRINGRVLGKRIPNDDARLFRKKTRKEKRDYFVQVGLDISGSTSDGAIVLIKESACAMAEMLARLGIRFAVHAHTGGPAEGFDTYSRNMEVVLYQIKGPDEPWNDQCRRQMGELQPEYANLDGHTMEFYRKRCEEQRATDKILLYYTDGAMPLENFREELEILQREIKICQARAISVVGVGIGNDDPTEHGLDTIRMDELEDIPRLIRDLERRLNG